jgi:hypothetical protein
MTLTENIVAIAKSYAGQEEIRENQGFKDPAFQTKMVSVGWYKGAPWCAFLAKLIWQEAFAISDTVGSGLVKKYANGSATQTYQNYAKSAEFHVSKTPIVGAEVIWEEGNGPAGHAGIVIEIDGPNIKTIEGNTNTDGSREGYIAAIKTRAISAPHSATGLNIVGFIYPIRIA